MKRFVAIIFFLVLSLQVHGIQVGVSPPVVDIGNVEPGSSTIVRFYVVTASSDTLTVNLEASPGSFDFFNLPTYKDLIYKYSEEDVNSWVQFLSNPVELLPSENIGHGIRGSREVNFLLFVPENAEPGTHIITIRPTPIFQAGEVGQGGAAVVAVTSVNILFNVAGHAERRGNILDVVYKDGNIETYFKNSGTVSITARTSHKIFDSSGDQIDTVSSIDLVRPGELHKFLAPALIQIGNFKVDTNIDFKTGTDKFNSDISVIQAATIAVQREQETSQEFPWWIIVIAIIIIFSIVIYKRRD